MQPTREDEYRMMQSAMRLYNTADRLGRHRQLIRDDKELSGIPHKRFDYVLEKWSGRGWWECGTTISGGWLTEKGANALQNALCNRNASKNKGVSNG